MKIVEFKIGKRTLELVAGLVWHPVHQTGSARVKEVANLAKASSLDLKIMRGVDSPHVGFAKKSEGGKPGQISAAAVIADTLSADISIRNFLVAVRIPGDQGQFIYVAVHDGVILADGDASGTRDEVRVRLTGDASYESWDAIICPGDWGVASSKEKEFEEFFNEEALKSPGKWALKESSVDLRKYTIPAVLLLVLLGGSVYGFNYWTKKKAAAAEALRIQQQLIADGQKATIAEPVKPWPLLPLSIPFAVACSEAFNRVGLTAGNWRLVTIDCSDDNLTARWEKPDESAWISHLKALRPDAVVALDGLSASVSTPAKANPSNDFMEALPPQGEISLRYYDLAARYGMALRIDPPAAPPVAALLPGQQATPVAVVAPSWLERPVQVTTSMDPIQVASILSYPGLRFKKISYANKAGRIQYQLIGVQYVNP